MCLAEDCAKRSLHSLRLNTQSVEAGEGDRLNDFQGHPLTRSRDRPRWYKDAYAQPAQPLDPHSVLSRRNYSCGPFVPPPSVVPSPSRLFLNKKVVQVVHSANDPVLAWDLSAQPTPRGCAGGCAVKSPAQSSQGLSVHNLLERLGPKELDPPTHPPTGPVGVRPAAPPDAPKNEAPAQPHREGCEGG
jgi:hypothetical protein